MSDESRDPTPGEATIGLADFRAMMGDELRMLETGELLERLRLGRYLGYTFSGKRNLHQAFGYMDAPGLQDYRWRYERGGVAGRVVDALPKATWRGGVELIEDADPKTETAFERDWNGLSQRLKLPSRLLQADILSRLGSFSTLLLGVADGNMALELPRGSGPDALLYVTPFVGPVVQSAALPGQARMAQARQADQGADVVVSRWDEDAKSPRFGQPLFYQLRRTSFAAPTDFASVHHSRVIHLADGCLDDLVFGEPALRRPWNLFDDLEKVTGGGAEAFFLRANKGTHVDIDKDVKSLTDPERKALRKEVGDYVNEVSRMLVTRGVKVSDLGSNVANFSDPADAVMTQIAGTCGIPKRVLTGSEMGELASSQDRENWRDQVNGRREQYAGPFVLERLADRLIAYGYLAAPARYEPRWGTVLNMTEDEKGAGALRWAQVNASNGSPVFTDDEIRDHWYGMEPVPDDVKSRMADARAQVPSLPAVGAQP